MRIFGLGWRWWLVDTRARVNDDEHEDAGLRKRYKGDWRYCLDNMETKWKTKRKVWLRRGYARQSP